MKIVNTTLIEEILNIENASILNSSDLLVDYDWDSLAMVMVQTHFSDTANKEIDPEDLELLKSVGDLDNFLTSNL